MSVLATNTRLGRKLLGALVIVTVLSSCAFFGSFGKQVRASLGMGHCNVEGIGQQEQALAGAGDDGSQSLFYTPGRFVADGRGCWSDRMVARWKPSSDMTLADANAGVIASTVKADERAGQLVSSTPMATREQNASVALPKYLGVETERLDDDLVQIVVQLSGDAVSNESVAAYAECAAAQYTLSRGFGFARHVLTSVKEKNGIWTGKSVYWVSEALPRGLITIDAAVTAQACFENGIPTV